MQNDTGSDAVPPPRPQSRSRRLLRRFRGWVVQCFVWDEMPTPAQFREACRERDQLRLDVYRLQNALASSRAVAEAATAELAILATVLERNHERVKAELAAATSQREAELSANAVKKLIRASGES